MDQFQILVNLFMNFGPWASHFALLSLKQLSSDFVLICKRRIFMPTYWVIENIHINIMVNISF